MKDRPILFSSPMVRAILNGWKTQTRRACHKSLQPYRIADKIGGGLWIFADEPSPLPNAWDNCTNPLSCPYGAPGDRLWVRENGWERPDRTPRMLREGADTWVPYYFDADGLTESDLDDFRKWGFKRRPSIHMPRSASRITLEIEAVRVERLNEISEEDAKAEGSNREAAYNDPGLRFESMAGEDAGAGPGYFCPRSYVDGFFNIWESINGSGSWDLNPWVWVIQFKRINAQQQHPTQS